MLDLRNPTRSDGNNILQLVNRYMDAYKKNPDSLALKAKAEKYAKITAKTIITSSGEDSASYGQNAFFYDAAEGLLTSVILLIAEFCPPEKRHIISVFKLIQDLLTPSPVKNKSQFQLLMDKFPSEHKAKVALCLDNDEAGLNAASRIHKSLQQKGFEYVEYDISAHKDWNEQLQAACAQEQSAPAMAMR